MIDEFTELEYVLTKLDKLCLCIHQVLLLVVDEAHHRLLLGDLKGQVQFFSRLDPVLEAKLLVMLIMIHNATLLIHDSTEVWVLTNLCLADVDI